METIYLSQRAQVAEGTFFMKSPVAIALFIFIEIMHQLLYVSDLSQKHTLNNDLVF